MIVILTKRVFRWLRAGLRWTVRGVRIVVALLLLTFFLQRSTYPLHINWNAVSVMVNSQQFDYVGWTLSALATKAGEFLWGVHPFMDEAARSDYVRAYMDDLRRAQALEAEIEAVYFDPAEPDPDRATAERRALRDDLRADLRGRQPLMESILEGQVAAVLIDEGFGVLGQLLPPISMHFTPMPNLLIASPRDRIHFEISISLEPMPVDERVAIEQRIEDELDLSALIVPLGGMALFPAMINETTNIPWALETFAHEWMHHYLFFFPLGLTYDFAGEARIINETVADLFGKAIAERALARYYPEYAPTAHDSAPIRVHWQATEPPAFDFGAEMHRTRTQVDRIMDDIALMQAKAEQAQGRGREAAHLDANADRLIVKAEDYMEARRVLFYENGWRIRRLNQAYFAFFGGYQGGIAGIGGQDPIGPAVQDILDKSASLRDFVVTMRVITNREQLLRVRDDLVMSGNMQ